MTIKLREEHRDEITASIKQYFLEHMDQDVGDLKAALLLDYFLKEIAPTIYNKAVADAQARMQEMVGELDGTCFEPEFTYWKR